MPDPFLLFGFMAIAILLFSFGSGIGIRGGLLFAESGRLGPLQESEDPRDKTLSTCSATL